jgi:WD40 repeat protein
LYLNTSSAVFSVAFSPDGKTLASGADDGSTLLWDISKMSAPLIRTCYGGLNGQWLAIDAGRRMYRYDDGALLMKKDKSGLLSPILPPIPKHKGKLEVKHKPSSLIIQDGNLTDFSLEIINRGQGRLYWINIYHDRDLDEHSPLNFFPSGTVIALEPGQSREIPCKVSALSDYSDTHDQNTILHLKMTALYDSQNEPVFLDIPATIM